MSVPTESSPLEPFLARLDELTAYILREHPGHPLIPSLKAAYNDLCDRVLDVPHDQAAIIAGEMLAKLNLSCIKRV